jgi:hypothetical protein
MASPSFEVRADTGKAIPEGWLMGRLRALQAALRRPRRVTVAELSPHLLRDIGLRDVAVGRRQGEP